MSQRLGDLLVKEKVITIEQFGTGDQRVQKETNCRLGSGGWSSWGFLNGRGDVTKLSPPGSTAFPAIKSLLL